MTPLKLTKQEAHRLERNLGTPAVRPNDETLVSLLHRMFWFLYVAFTGKSYSLHEVRNDARLKLILDRFVKQFLPELRRKLK